MDGRIARAQGITSRYGAFIDSLLDRFIELFFFVGFAFFARHTRTAPWPATLALGASVLVSYARAMGESLGVECTGGLMQRGERLALLASAAWRTGRLRRARPADRHPATGVVYFIGVTACDGRPPHGVDRAPPARAQPPIQ